MIIQVFPPDDTPTYYDLVIEVEGRLYITKKSPAGIDCDFVTELSDEQVYVLLCEYVELKEDYADLSAEVMHYRFMDQEW